MPEAPPPSSIQVIFDDAVASDAAQAASADDGTVTVTACEEEDVDVDGLLAGMADSTRPPASRTSAPPAPSSKPPSTPPDSSNDPPLPSFADEDVVEKLLRSGLPKTKPPRRPRGGT